MLDTQEVNGSGAISDDDEAASEFCNPETMKYIALHPHSRYNVISISGRSSVAEL